MGSSLSTSVPEYVDVCSSVETTHALSSAIKVLVEPAEKLSSTRSAATVDVPFSSRHCPVVLHHLLANTSVTDQRTVGILKYLTIVMGIKKFVQNVPRRRSKINPVGYLMFDVARDVGANSSAARISAESNAIGPVNARILGVLVSNSAAKPRKHAAILNKMIITCDCQHLKQEIKCNASRSSVGNSKKALPCDDECARLERNRKLALALNIDPQAHKDDHIPYSTQTLQLYQENPKWAQSQERELRVFANDPSEKRLRFKPMLSHQRQFIHSLSEDFGFDTEGVDPEPQRHVFVFKTPKFVSAPTKTLSECIRIRNAAATEAASLSHAEDQRRQQFSNEPYNGFILTGPRFALTLDELRADCSSVLDVFPNITFSISFLPSEQIVLKAQPTSPLARISATSTEDSLKSLKASLTSIITTKQIATSVHLCTLDTSLNILRRENDSSAATGGWSQVAAKAASGARPAPSRSAVGDKSSFTVLGSRLKDAKRKKEAAKTKEKVEVVEDWEEEVRREEEAASTVEGAWKETGSAGQSESEREEGESAGVAI
ncbi:MAG: FKBP12-associated protein [Icmadophila ericetorum]|nr:FKBP12-associated protein [Icmadophila ericetorum]